ncbi:hypothetical protein [Catenulispora sp. MAP12-49]|uniref:hypothetical protein n=1 Tax=Catenulispora sp. MAP12-49 TaxID=3156302 RepID=UPI0035165063
MDTPDQVRAYADVMHQAFDVVEESGDYANRGTSRMVRKYMDLRLRADFDLGDGADLLDVVRRLAGAAARWKAAGTRWRTVITDSESLDGIALVCTDPGHPDVIDGIPGASSWMYDCCDPDVIETHDVAMAAFLIAALNEALPLLTADQRMKRRWGL